MDARQMDTETVFTKVQMGWVQEMHAAEQAINV